MSVPKPPPPPDEDDFGRKIRSGGGWVTSRFLAAIRVLMAVPSIARILVVDLQPGDVLVLECDDALSDDGAARAYHLLQRIWPGRQCLVLDRRAHLKVIAEQRKA